MTLVGLQSLGGVIDNSRPRPFCYAQPALQKLMGLYHVKWYEYRLTVLCPLPQYTYLTPCPLPFAQAFFCLFRLAEQASN